MITRRSVLSVALAGLVAVSLSGCGTTPPPAPSGSPNVQSTLDLAQSSRSSTDADLIIMGGVKQAQNLDDYLRLAESCRSSTTADQIRMQGLSAAKSVDDYVRLAGSCRSSTTGDQIRLQGLSSAKSVDELVRLAQSCRSATDQDKLLLQGVGLAKSNAEFKKLANACRSSTNRDRIINQASVASTDVSGKPSEQLSGAYQDMQNAYAAYQKAVEDKVSKDQLKTLSENYKNKKIAYDKMVKNH